MTALTIPAASRSARLLALASAGVFCGLAATALGITVLGKVHRPEIVMDLSAPLQPRQSAVLSVATPATQAAPPAAIGKAVFAGNALVADPALIENSLQGPLPRIADDGRKPMTAYAAPALSGKFRIAVVVSGLGTSAKATTAALANLPAGVTLAFAPYAVDLQHWVSQSRQLGHEALLEVPMEPFDFPDSDPGPHTLRSGVDQDANGERLDWALSRFTGYAGVTNLLGQRFLADADSLSPTMTQLFRRGLYFYDNGAVAQSAAEDVAGRSGVSFAKATEALDGIQTALEIDKHLSDLEAQARDHGSAVGSGSLYPVTVERIAAWAKTLERRGFVLVPVSAIVSQPTK
jgi:polysaccharide deacetylase 2 family uncharacterized protein YibQ